MKKKNFIALIIASAIVTGMVTPNTYYNKNIFSVKADNVELENGLIYYKSPYDNEICIEGCRDDIEIIDIPSEIDGCPVTSIDYAAFENHKNLKSVNIPDTVTLIGGNAFCGCTSLSSITIPESISYFGIDFAKDTPWRKNIKNEDNLIIINNILVDGRDASGEIIIPETVKKVYCNAFSECKSLEKVYIPKTVEEIEDGAFNTAVSPSGFFFGGSSFGSLEEIKVDPENEFYKDIDGVLFDKSGETLIQFPSGRGGEYQISDGTKTIGMKAFYCCSNLLKVECPDSLEVIDYSAFEMCASLYDIKLSQNLKSIERYAFSNCRNLRSIIIPESVTYIGSSAFFYADLDEITFENPDVEICGEAIINDYYYIENNRVYYYTGVIYGPANSTVKEYAEKYNCRFALRKGKEGPLYYNVMEDCIEITGVDDGDNSENSVLNIPETIEGLPVTSYYGYTIDGYYIANLPSGIKSMKYSLQSSYHPFYSFAQINISSDNPYFTSVDGVVFSKDMSKIACYPSRKKMEAYSIPEGVKEICEGSFYYAKIEKITFPESLVSINENPFWNSYVKTVEGYDGTPASELANEINADYVSLGIKTLPYDINDDGMITAKDISALVKCIIDNTNCLTKRTDVNGDGNINVADLIALRDFML